MFARSEWTGFEWLTPEDDRGRFLLDFINSVEDAIVMGGKETAKSLTFALLAIWWMLSKPAPIRDVGIIAGSEPQAKVTYTHLRKLLLSAAHSQVFLAEEPLNIRCNLRNGAESWVYAASFYSAHGKHPGLMIGDEAVLASQSQDGEVLKGALASVTTGGRRVMGSAPYFEDAIFMQTWRKAEEYGYRRYGPWRKHPWQELQEPYVTPISRRPWLTIDEQINEALRALKDPNSNYRCFWMGELEAGVGDIFPAVKIDLISEVRYSLEPIVGCRKALGVDTGFRSSKFAVVGVEERDGLLYVILGEEYERPSFNEMARAVAKLFFDDHYETVYVDASDPAFIDQLRHYGVSVEEVVFTHMNRMIGSTRFYIEQEKLKVDKGFPDLIWQLKNARYAKSGLKIDKTGVSQYDSVDALFCALEYWAKPSSEPVVVT
mgnify:CR=1 FL=1